MLRAFLKKGDVISGAVLAALGVFIITQALAWDYYTLDGPGPGFFPFWYGVAMVVLSLLLVLQRQDKPQPSLLVAPASLLANWVSEIERFAPGLKALIAHPSALPAAELKALPPERLQEVDLVITSYG